MVYFAALPLYYVMSATNEFSLWDVVFFSLAFSGPILEFFADSQLQNFIRFEKKQTSEILTVLISNFLNFDFVNSSF
jgi:steroid 5-alpha reductase family enzyme